MKKVLVPLLVLLLVATGCSSKKKGSVEGVQQGDAQEKMANDFVVDSDEQDLFLDDKKTDEQEQNVDIVENTPSVNAPAIDGECETASYQVKEGEILMQIAFKLYGDYRKWKELAAMNQGVNVTSLAAGQNITYCTGNELSWKPQGNPHVIRTGETLGIISNDKYGTINRWKDLWENNKPMIHDPNIIFAGFTLYWIPDDSVADL